MGNGLFGCHEFVLGLCTALAHAGLRPIDYGSTGSHVGVHCTCACMWCTPLLPKICESPFPGHQSC